MALWTRQGYCPSAALTRHHVFGAFREVCRRASALASPRPVHFDCRLAPALCLPQPCCFIIKAWRLRLLRGSSQEDTQIDSCRWRSQRRGMELTQTRRLGRYDQWLAGRCPLFRPLLTILYAHQRSTSDYSTARLARWTGCVRARCVAACLGSDESSCMLRCTSAHDACVR